MLCFNVGEDGMLELYFFYRNTQVRHLPFDSQMHKTKMFSLRRTGGKLVSSFAE